jgi:hypothetical protein
VAAVAYVAFLATILLLGGYGCWKTRRDQAPVPMGAGPHV